MSNAKPVQFRRDVVAVARKREMSVRQIAKDFGISEATLYLWLNKPISTTVNDPGAPA
jgi:transposase